MTPRPVTVTPICKTCGQPISNVSVAKGKQCSECGAMKDHPHTLACSRQTAFKSAKRG